MQDQAERKRSRLLRWQRAASVIAVALPVAAGITIWQQQHERAATVPPVPQAAAPVPQLRLADFQGVAPSPDARLLANWVAATGDNGSRAFMVVDKKDPRVYVFSPDARLKDSSPVLLGQARGDDIVPGSGPKTPAEMKPEEKTTPAGRFVAEPGVNADDEDVIWVDYENAISMHRVRPAVAREHRVERLASAAPADNRISFGCINLPVPFYENVARPVAVEYGAIVYVLPEVKTLQQVFGAYDVTDPAQVAAAQQGRAAGEGVRAAAPSGMTA
jgi:hypothetical protein